MPKERSGLASSADRSDYDAGGDGLLGSRRFNDIYEANEAMGVRYLNDDYDGGRYDDSRSDGDFAQWYRNATPAEREAVRDYTGESYSTINDYLRSQNLDNAPQWVKDTVRNIDKAVNKFYLSQPITVWRGGSNKLVGGAVTVEDVNRLKGAVVIDRGITSTAMTKEASWTDAMKYEIVYPKGRGRGVFADPVSKNHTEQEFMAARNTQYEVLGGYKDDMGRTVCRLKAIYPKRSRKRA